MRLAKTAVSPAVHVTVRDQHAIGRVGVERIQGVSFERQTLEGAFLQVGPHVLAFLQPGSDFALRQVVGKGDIVFPAVKFPHFQQKDTQGEVARMPRVRDVAVFLDSIDQLSEIQHEMMLTQIYESIGPSTVPKPAQILWGQGR